MNLKNKPRKKMTQNRNPYSKVSNEFGKKANIDFETPHKYSKYRHANIKVISVDRYADGRMVDDLVFPWNFPYEND